MLQTWIDYFDHSGGNLLPLAIGGLIAVVCLLVVWILILTGKRSEAAEQAWKPQEPARDGWMPMERPGEQRPDGPVQPAAAQGAYPAEPAPVPAAPAAPAPEAAAAQTGAPMPETAPETFAAPTPAAGPYTAQQRDENATVAMPGVQLHHAVKGVGRRVLLVDRQNPAKVYEVWLNPEAVLGRSPEADLSFPEEKYMARRQCRLVDYEGNVYVQDLASTNGTYVNGVPAGHTALLPDGAVLSMGRLELIVRL